jgi:xylan 1,4-beta-xylosidase
MKHFAQHLVERYGIDEVSHVVLRGVERAEHRFLEWHSTAAILLRLVCAHGAGAEGVSPRLRVGGPATAAAALGRRFSQVTAEHHVPVDFVSTHGYADDTWKIFSGPNENIPMDDRVCRAVAKVQGRDQAVQFAQPAA